MKFGATVLHDFFVDRIVFVPDMEGFVSRVRAKGSQGGGGIHGVLQEQIRGGNAVNVAEELARLGTATYLITHSDGAHLEFLRRQFNGLPAQLSVKDLEPGLTVALETGRKGRKSNIMLGHAGGAGDFSSRLLGERDWSAMRSSKVVCSVNWSANRSGTELLEALRSGLGGRRTIFLDPADVRDRLGEFARLLRRVKSRGLVDWLSVNEFEAAATARLLGITVAQTGYLCRAISEDLGVRVDIHTEGGSYTSDGAELFFHKTRTVVPRVLTGAGDVWDAASVHFFLKGERDQKRIELADLAAGLYVRSRRPRGPSEKEVLLLQHA